MKTILLSAAGILYIYPASVYAQNVGINTDGSVPTMMLDIKLPATAASDGIRINNTAGTGDGIVNFQDNGTSVWTLGWDDSDGDDFKISQSGALGTTDALIIETNAQGLQILAGQMGAAALPTFGFDGDDNTGWWHPAADNLAFSTNGLERMRLRQDGEVIVGATTTVIADDLFSAVGNVTLDWPVNGYTGFNGGGVYGQVTGGTTAFSSIQGEYVGTGAGAGVYGAYMSNVAGTGFTLLTTRVGVRGNGVGTGSYRFGVFGDGGTSIRSGGVIGNDYNIARGALGYYASNGADYCVYGFGQGHTNGVGGGMVLQNGGVDMAPTQRSAETLPSNATIGIGIYGGFMGGWVHGDVYGTNFRGSRYAVYSHGKQITNDVFVSLADNGTNQRTATYASTSTRVEISATGKGAIASGSGRVDFDPEFAALLSDNEDVIVVITPLGNCNGVFVSNVSSNGFDVTELMGGNASVAFSWIATGVRKGYEQVEVSSEILDKSYELHMNGLMFNDAITNQNASPVWYDGRDIRFDAPPAKDTTIGQEERMTATRAKERMSGTGTSTPR
jgi:hypothetical protein